MPLNQRVSFKTRLRKLNRFQVPKRVRWQVKLEPSKLLKVTVSIEGSMSVKESFLVKCKREGA